MLVIVALPYERFVGPASLRVVDGIVALLCVVTAVIFWRSRRRLVVPLVWPMWLILLSSLVATILGVAYVTNVTAVIQEIYLWLFLIVMTNLLLLHNPQERDRLLTIWVVVACIIALTTLMGMLHIGPAMFYEIPYRDRYPFEGLDRGVGTYINPNAAAAYLSTSFFIAIGAPIPLGWRVLTGIWIFAGMYGTGSNGAMGTTLLALVLLLAVFSMMRRRRAVLGWVGVLAGGTAVSLPLLDRLPAFLPTNNLAINGLFDTSVRRVARAVTVRRQLWKAGWHEFQKRPWGIGPNSASEIQASLHNDYLAFLFERGPVGVLGWLLLLLEPLVYVVRAAGKAQADKQRQWQILALGAGFVANAMNAAVHELSHTRPLWLLMAFIFAQSIALLRQTQEERPPLLTQQALQKGIGL
jgi:O-antigen ligase